MTTRQQAQIWLLAFAAFLLFVYVFNDILLPFVLGAGVAYLLNPLVEKLGRFKVNRTWASLLILGTFIVFVAVLLALIVPLLYNQASQLAGDLPGYLQNLKILAEPYVGKILALGGHEQSLDMGELAKNNADKAAGVAAQLLGGVAAGGRAMASFISVLVLMPIVAYFMMKEWVNICNWIEDLLPRPQKNTILDLLSQINQKLSGFIRGQLSVAALLGAGYAIALSLAGLKYGFLIGLAAGVLSIIPMLGSITGLLVAVAVAWFQQHDLMYVAIIAGIFLAGQIIEGNFLTPKLVGDSVGLHPLWVFFALMAGGALFGILGMLLAVPVAAVSGVLLAFAIARYKSGPLYKGAEKKKTKP